MSARASSRLLVQALIRKTQSEGGFAAVLHSGDEIAGSIMVQTVGPDRKTMLLERMPDFFKNYVLAPVAAQYWGDPGELAQYVGRRVRSDPDLWVIELDVANAERLAAAILIGD